jgi:hypothetical protein
MAGDATATSHRVRGSVILAGMRTTPTSSMARAARRAESRCRPGGAGGEGEAVCSGEDRPARTGRSRDWPGRRGQKRPKQRNTKKQSFESGKCESGKTVTNPNGPPTQQPPPGPRLLTSTPTNGTLTPRRARRPNVGCVRAPPKNNRYASQTPQLTRGRRGLRNVTLRSRRARRDAPYPGLLQAGLVLSAPYHGGPT